MGMRWIPNLLTCCRIGGTAAMLFLEPLSPGFYWAYTLSGVSDVLDGTAARALHCASEFGAKLDSWADLLFYGVMLVRLLPVLIAMLPVFIWLLLALALAIRLSAYLTAWKKFHVFASLHTWMNKITGFFVFLIPYALKTNFYTPYCYCAVTVATLAGLEELVIHLQSREYPNCKSIFELKQA